VTDLPILIAIGLGLVLTVVVAFKVHRGRPALLDHAIVEYPADRRQLLGARMGHELRSRTVRPPRRYLDTEYWLAAGGDILAIDILSLTRPESPPNSRSD
jgi:hypothetical protein